MKPAASERAFCNSRFLILCVLSVGVVAGSGVSMASSSPALRESGTGSGISGKGAEKKPQSSLGKFNSTAPTAATFESFSADRYAAGVFIQWRTGYEIDNLGFRLYRVQGAKRVLITPQMLAGSALVTGQGTPLTAGKSYAWWDSSPKNKDSASYWLEELDLKGESIWHGPVDAKFAGGSPPEQVRAAELAGLGRTDAPSRPVQTWSTPANIGAGQ